MDFRLPFNAINLEDVPTPPTSERLARDDRESNIEDEVIAAFLKVQQECENDRVLPSNIVDELSKEYADKVPKLKNLGLNTTVQTSTETTERKGAFTFTVRQLEPPKQRPATAGPVQIVVPDIPIEKALPYQELAQDIFVHKETLAQINRWINPSASKTARKIQKRKLSKLHQSGTEGRARIDKVSKQFPSDIRKRMYMYLESPIQFDLEHIMYEVLKAPRPKFDIRKFLIEVADENPTKIEYSSAFDWQAFEFNLEERS